MNPAAPPPRLSALLLAFSFFPFLAFSYDCASSCANIAHISYPFGAGSYCGYPGFQLSCAFESAQWMLDLAPGYSMPAYYKVNRIDVGDDRVRGGVSLSWSSESSAESCSVIRSDDSKMNYSLFSGANLAVFNTSILTYSEVDMFLLLGCTNPPDSAEDQFCTKFTNACPQISFQNQSANLRVPIGDCTYFAPVNRTDAGTELKQALQQYDCSFYRSFVNDSSIESSFQLAVELNWTLKANLNSQCFYCETSNGTCGFNNQTGNTFVCYRENNAQSSNVYQGGIEIKGAIIGAVVGSVLLIGCLYIVFGLPFRAKRKHTHNRGAEVLEAKLQQHRILIFTPEHMKAATRNYHNDNKLGEGGFGCVYKGTLRDGQVVAVKRLSRVSHHGERQFLSEVESITNIKHRNIIKLLGCCVDGSDRLLVYEYLPKQSLDKHIFAAAQPLKWSIRREIILGTAKGLAYLHHDEHSRIVHRDVKPANILLDDNLNPKIADFGLARLFACEQTHLSTQIAGTIGYLAPEYAMHGQLTERSDTYSFGLVILEIVSGRRVIEYRLPPEQQCLLSWSWRLFQDQRQLELLDPLLKDDYITDEVLRVVHVALLCTQLEPESRPTMSKVVLMLESESEIIDVPAKPDLLFGDGLGHGLRNAPLTSSSTTPLISENRSHVCVDSIGT